MDMLSFVLGCLAGGLVTFISTVVICSALVSAEKDPPGQPNPNKILTNKEIQEMLRQVAQ